MPTNSHSAKTTGSGLYAPALALKYIADKLGITDSQLEHQHGLNRKTLRKLHHNQEISHAYEFYFGVFVALLNNHRLLAIRQNNQTRVDEIDYLLRDLLLAHFGLPTDAEMMQNEQLKKKAGYNDGGLYPTY